LSFHLILKQNFKLDKNFLKGYFIQYQSRGSSVVERSPEKAGVGSSILPPGNKKLSESVSFLI
jgi:hypothetical protein